MKKAGAIPGASKPSFFKSKRLAEVLASGPPIIGAGIVTYRLWDEPNLPVWLAPVSAFGILWLLASAFMKIAAAARADKADTPDVVHEGLYAAVSTLHAMISHVCQRHDCGADIRATFHRIVPPIQDPEHIEQIIPYVGSAASAVGDVGRKFAIGMGITGRAVRIKSAVSMSSGAASEKEHKDELVADWGYTDARAKDLTSGRYSAVAVPILADGGRQALGVVYLDSGDRSVFEREDVLQILGVGCEAISSFVTKRY